MRSASWKVAWVVLFGCVCLQQCSAAKYKPYKMVPFDETSPEGPFRECEVTPGEVFGKDSYKTGIFITPTAADNWIRAKVAGPHLGPKGDRRHDHHDNSGENDSHEHRDSHEQHDHDDDDDVHMATSTAATIADVNLCRIFHLSDDAVYKWSGGGRYRMQFTVTIESWKNGCFFVNNLDVPDAGEALSRACYINGRYIEELSKGMRPSETQNATSGLTRSYNMVELVIIVYPGWDVKNLKFWWTRETNPGDVTVTPTTTIPSVVSENNQTATTGHENGPTTFAPETPKTKALLTGKARKKREAKRDDDIGGRVVITPLLIGADEPEGGLQNVNRHCERIGNGDFGECPYSGCAHYSFFCDGHFNCANGRVGDYDESWLVCGWILRRVVLPMISLLVLTMAAIAAVCLLKKNSWLARRRNGNDAFGFRSGTASRRCSINPLPLDASSLETEEQRRRRLKEREAAGIDATDTRTRRLSAGSRVTVSEQTPDLMLAPAYEHPPDYQTAVTVPVHTVASQPSNLQNSVQT